MSKKNNKSNSIYSNNIYSYSKFKKNFSYMLFTLAIIFTGLMIYRFITSDNYPDVLSLLISVISLFIAYSENQLNTKMLLMTFENNAISVRPYLQLDTNLKDALNSDNELKIVLRNTGIGPAVITKMKAWLNNEKHNKEYRTLYDLIVEELKKSLDNTGDIYEFIRGNITLNMYTIPANESIDLVHIRFSKKIKQSLKAKIIEIISEAVIYCEYVDIYHMYDDLDDSTANKKSNDKNRGNMNYRQFTFERKLDDLIYISDWMLSR